MRTITASGHQHPFEALWPKARCKVLGLLFSQPESRYYLREIARRTGLAASAVQRETASLVKAGVLQKWVEPHHAYYQADPGCPIFSELHRIFLKTTGLVGVLRQSLSELAEVHCAFIYGSIARGEATAESDVDLVVIGETPFRAVADSLFDAQQSLDREINPIVYSPHEFRGKLAAGQHFITAVMQQPKLFVIGDRDVLERLAGSRFTEETLPDSGGD